MKRASLSSIEVAATGGKSGFAAAVGRGAAGSAIGVDGGSLQPANVF